MFCRKKNVYNVFTIISDCYILQSFVCLLDNSVCVLAGEIGSAKISLRSTSMVDKEDEQVSVELNQPVTLTFSTRYLVSFSKATPLSSSVTLSLKAETPLGRPLAYH